MRDTDSPRTVLCSTAFPDLLAESNDVEFPAGVRGKDEEHHASLRLKHEQNPSARYALLGLDSASPTVPPRYAFRLEDLRVFHLVRASCHACGHKAIIPNATLQQGRPGYTRLMSLERQLRCRNCGAKGKASLEVMFRSRD